MHDLSMCGVQPQVSVQEQYPKLIVDCSKSAELHPQATCYVYILWLRSSVLNWLIRSAPRTLAPGAWGSVQQLRLLISTTLGENERSRTRRSNPRSAMRSIAD